MLRPFALLLLGLWPLLLPSQTPFSGFGQVHTPQGDLHLLVIFARFTDADKMHARRAWPDSQEVLPLMAQGASNQLFHARVEDLTVGPRVQNLSDYYYTLSRGAFRLTADVFPVQVPVTYVREQGGNFFQRQRELNQAVIDWIAANYPDFDWGRYDRRRNGPGFAYDNRASAPDSVLDYVVFMYRDYGNTGMGTTGSLAVPGTPYRIRDGHTGIKSYADAKHNWEYFKHEFAHQLFSAPHYLGANSADGSRYYTQKGWGLMATWHAPFFTTNAWEAWWLDWSEPVTVAANGRYYLGDFATTGDALRIPLPGTEDVLWLENHQKQDLWDDKIFYGDTSRGHPVSAPGLYMYVSSPPANRRSAPRLNPFSPRDVNFIRMYNAEGNFDYAVRDSQPNEYGARFPVFEKVAPNPIAGQNDFQFIRADFNGDGQIGVGYRHGNKDGGPVEQMDVWFERREGETRYSYNCTGDMADAGQVGDHFGLDGRFPLLNFPVWDRQAEALSPYVLNGLSVRVEGQDEQGGLWLDIRQDAWDIRGRHRWCGPLLLPADSAALPLRLWGTIDLALGGTPDRRTRHPETGTFTNPTRLEVAPGRTVVVERGGQLVVGAHSALVLAPGSHLIVAAGGSLTVEADGQVVVPPGAVLAVERRGRLALAPGSQLLPETETGLQPARGARLRDRSGN